MAQSKNFSNFTKLILTLIPKHIFILVRSSTIHTILITKAIVMAVQRQHSCRVLANHQKSDSLIGFETQKGFWNMVRFTISKIAIWLIPLGSFMICTHDIIILTKRKEQSSIANRTYLVGKRSRQLFLSF
jgi:hypothetical protein